MQLPMPAVWSVPAKATATERLYQPFESAARAGVPLVTVGAVASYFRAYPSGALTLPARSVHVPAGEAAVLSGPP